MSSTSGEYSYFWVRRLHSIVGVFLVLAFTILYLIPLSSAFGGAKAFNGFMLLFDNVPMIGLFEVLFVIVPLIIHAILALIAVYSSSINVVGYNHYRNWMYALKRITGILLVPFVAYHIFATTLKFAFTGRHINYSYMQTLLSPAWMKVFYGVGIACAIFYLGASVETALFEWGVTVSRRSRDVVSVVMWCIAISLTVWGVKIVLAF